MTVSFIFDLLSNIQNFLKFYFSKYLNISLPQSYTGQTGGGGAGSGGGGTASGNGAGDEDYEIPPITPPNHPEPHLLHLMEHDSTGYLCHSLPHNGLINPYSYSELPTLMMSNMLAQDSHLVSSQMPSVSSTMWTVASKPNLELCVLLRNPGGLIIKRNMYIKNTEQMSHTEADKAVIFYTLKKKNSQTAKLFLIGNRLQPNKGEC